MTLFPRLALISLSLGLAACNSTPPTVSAPAPAPSGYAVARVTAPGFKLPEGSDCSGAIARYQAVMDNDYQTGNVNQSVYHTISGEIASARSACAAGHDGEAQSLIAASKSRHGYPN